MAAEKKNKSTGLDRVDEYIQLTGTSTPITLTALSILFIAVFIWVFFGKISDKAYVKGVIFPSQGTVAVNLPNNGLVRTLFIHKGDKVTEGQTLALVSIDGSYSIVSAPCDGEVLSYIVEGGEFNPFEGIVNILPAEKASKVNTLVALADFKTSRDLKPGQKAQVTPSYDSRERIGYIEGEVRSIVPYPISRQEADRFFENESIVDEIFPESGAVFMVEIDLKPDETDPSGLLWSFKGKEEHDASVGTYCNVQVIVKSRSLFAYLMENVQDKSNAMKLWLK